MASTPTPFDGRRPCDDVVSMSPPPSPEVLLGDACRCSSTQRVVTATEEVEAGNDALTNNFIAGVEEWALDEIGAARREDSSLQMVGRCATVKVVVQDEDSSSVKSTWSDRATGSRCSLTVTDATSSEDGISRCRCCSCCSCCICCGSCSGGDRDQKLCLNVFDERFDVDNPVTLETFRGDETTGDEREDDDVLRTSRDATVCGVVGTATSRDALFSAGVDDERDEANRCRRLVNSSLMSSTVVSGTSTDSDVSYERRRAKNTSKDDDVSLHSIPSMPFPDPASAAATAGSSNTLDNDVIMRYRDVTTTTTCAVGHAIAALVMGAAMHRLRTVTTVRLIDALLWMFAMTSLLTSSSVECRPVSAAASAASGSSAVFRGIPDEPPIDGTVSRIEYELIKKTM